MLTIYRVLDWIPPDVRAWVVSLSRLPLLITARPRWLRHSSTPHLHSHLAAMHTEPLCERGDADPVRSGCLHSVRFLVGQLCSSATPWLCGGPEQRVISPASRLGDTDGSSIPRGDKQPDPLSLVPIVLDCVHS